MTTIKIEFVNSDCGLVAEAEFLGDKWFIEVRTDAPLNTLAKDNEADVLEWALQHGFRRRRPPRMPGEPMRVTIKANPDEPMSVTFPDAEFPRRKKPWPNMCK